MGLVLCWLCRVLKNGLVISIYNLLYVRHATVAEFEGVSVEDFPQLVVSREAFINQRYSLNDVLLIAKFSIYCNCLQDKKLSFDSFLILL